MNELVKADIFFFITSIAVVVASVVLTVAFIYLIQILRDVRYITKRVRRESDEIIEDVHEARNFIKKEVQQALDIKELIGGVVQSVFSRGRKRSPRKKKS